MSTPVSELLGQLTIDEKISLVSGADVWRTAAIARVGLGSIKVTDGPNGARGDSSTGARAVCLPAAIALGASFDPTLVAEVGRLLGRETVRKGSHVLLAPTINIARHPLGGRNFESMGEDPKLTSELAVAYIQGVQDEGVGACAKHLVANDVEWHRLTVSSEVTEAVLREVYLAPFEAAAEADVWTMMAAYPKLNGIHCTEHAWLLTDVVRDEWGYEGLIMSDWGATLSAAAPIVAGLDLEMPGPAHALGAKLKNALDAGEVAEADLDKRVVRVLQLAQRAGRVGSADEAPEQSVDLPEERALARRAATSGMVLLRNRATADRPATLPFVAPSLGSVAVIGPNAQPGVIQGGGSAQLPAHHIVSPVEGIGAALPGATVSYRAGVLSHRYLPLIKSDQWVATEGRPVTIELFDNYTLEGEPLSVRHGRNIHVFLQGVVDGPTNNMVWSQRITGTVRVDTTGDYQFGVMQTGGAKVFVNDKLVVDNWNDTVKGFGFFEHANEERIGSVHLEAGTEATIRVEWNRGDNNQLAGVRLGWLPPVDEDAMLDEAVAAAAASDAAVVVVGLDADWETESHDRPMFALPGRQDELIARVVAANPNTVVVINAGSAIDMPWLDTVPAALLVWYPGQEFGNALADVLLGLVDPGGRMPVTFPKAVADGPTAGIVPGGADEKLFYSEGLLVGHRWYDKHEIEPLVPFGFGLSYASFTFGEPVLDENVVSVDVTNTAAIAGTCVVQGYLAPPTSETDRPKRVLAGFVSAEIAAGASETLRFALSDRSFQRWSDGGWASTPGDHTLSLGTSSRSFFAELTVSR